MSANLSLADHAANFIMAVSEQEHPDIHAIATKLFEAADEAAAASGATSFVALAEQLNVVAVATAASVSRDAFEQALALRQTDDAGAAAAVHLMSLNLIDGLKDADAAKKVAELAAYLYSQETAYRRLTKAN